MDYLRILCGTEQVLPVYSDIVLCLQDISIFPDLIEPIYRQALSMNEEDLVRLRFGLLRLQMYADINRNQDLDIAQQIKYIAELLEETLFGDIAIARGDQVEE